MARQLPEIMGWRVSRLCGALLLAAAFAAGCDSQQVASLTPFGPADTSNSLVSRVDPCADHAEEDRLIRDLLQAVNAERARHGLRPLRVSSTLSQIAEFYACRLVDGRFFTHIDPFDGSTVDSRAADFGYAFLKIGENLAASQRTVEQAMEDWMSSPGHRANILDPAFTEIGVAVKRGGEYGIYWVQEFGRPLTDGEDDAPAAGAASQPSSRPAK